MRFKVQDVRNVQNGENTALEVTYHVYEKDELIDVQTFKISAAFLRLETVENIVRTAMINHYYAVRNLPEIISAVRDLEFTLGTNDQLGNLAYGQVQVSQ